MIFLSILNHFIFYYILIVKTKIKKMIDFFSNLDEFN
jgi:hypothetical protein